MILLLHCFIAKWFKNNLTISEFCKTERAKQCNNTTIQEGFTLIELLLVVSLIFTISLTATPFYARFFNQNAIDNTTDQLVHSLRKAQLYSMMGKQSNNCIGAPCNWGVNYSGNTITLYLGNSYANRNQAFDEKFTVNSAITINGFTEIVFTKTSGVPTSTTATITISEGSNTKTLVMNNQGVVSRQN